MQNADKNVGYSGRLVYRSKLDEKITKNDLNFPNLEIASIDGYSTILKNTTFLTSKKWHSNLFYEVVEYKDLKSNSASFSLTTLKLLLLEIE